MPKGGRLSDYDPVNKPQHYISSEGLEAIDVIEAFGLGYHLGNVAKYILRAGRKDDAIQDLMKARWYLERHIANSVKGTESKTGS